jgi:CP family cyanate transporter-like MFS transporter
VAPLLARRIGLERAVRGAGADRRRRGAALGGAGGCLYGGTALIGAGIALGNVLLPSLLKRDFPARIAPSPAPMR